MDTNQVSLTRTMLNVTTPNNQGVNFSQGEVVKGVVQEVRPDGTVMITIKGQTIEALTEVPVQPGQQLYLKVDDFRDGKTFLKVVTPQAMEVIENANLSANLVEMGIPAKEENVAMARKLLESNMPVTINNLSEMAKGVKLLGAATPRNLEIVAFIMSRNLPVDESTLKAFEQYTLPGSNISKLLDSVIQSLRKLGQTQGAELRANPEIILADAANDRGAGTKTTAASNANISNSSAATGSGNGIGGTSIPGGQGKPEAIPTPTVPAGGPITTNLEPTASGPVITGNTTVIPTELELPVVMSTPDNDQVQVTADKAAAPSTNAANSSIDKAFPPIPANQAAATNTAGATTAAGPTLPDTPTAETPILTNANIASDQPTSRTTPSQPLGQTPGTAATQDEGAVKSTVTTPAAGTPDLPEETPISNRVPANMPENTAGKTAPVPSGQTAAPPMNAEMPELESPAGLAGKVAVPEPEAAQQSSAAISSKPQDNTTPVTERSSFQAPGSASDTSKSGMPLTPDLQKSADSAAQQTSSSTGLSNITTGSGKISEQLNLLKTLIEWMQVDGREPAADISGKLERAVASDKDVIRGLNLLQDAIKSENTQNRSPMVHDLLQRIDNLEKELSGQKMFNYLSRTSNDNQFNFYYFSIPVQVGEEMHQCQLRFNKDGRRDLRNVDNLNFVVSLDTGKMGLVLFHVNWQRSGSLTLQGVVENDDVARYLNANTQNLVSKLKDLGYSVHNLGIKVSQEQIDESLKAKMEETPLSIRPLGIDITV